MSVPSRAETELSREIQKALEKVGVWVIRIQSGVVKVRRGYMQLAPKGTPDLLLPAYGAFLEVKMPGEKPTKPQQEWHERARREGVRVEVVSSPAQAVNFALSWRAEREHERAMGWR